MQHRLFALGTVDIPLGWKDRSILSFVAPNDGKSSATSIVLHQDDLASEDSLDNYSDRELVKAAQRLPGYELQARRSTTCRGTQAREISYRWRTPDDIQVFQRQLYAHADATRLLIVTMTTVDPDIDKTATLWTNLIQSLFFEPELPRV